MLNKNKILILFSIIFLIVLSFGSGVVKAQPTNEISAVISFSGLEYNTYYVSLLSKMDSQPNYSKESINVVADMSNAEKEVIQELFSDYLNTSTINGGYYGCDTVVKLTDNKTLEWTYDLGDEFVVLIYVVEEYKFTASTVLENYASTSYYKVYVFRTDGELSVFAEKNKSYFKEAALIIIKILFAICLEILAAYAFKFSTQKHIATICAVNFITQAAFSILMYFTLSSLYYLTAILAGAVIFALEALIYSLVFVKLDNNSKGLTILKTLIYAFLANTIAIGLEIGIEFLRAYAIII